MGGGFHASPENNWALVPHARVKATGQIGYDTVPDAHTSLLRASRFGTSSPQASCHSYGSSRKQSSKRGTGILLGIVFRTCIGLAHLAHLAPFFLFLHLHLRLHQPLRQTSDIASSARR